MAARTVSQTWQNCCKGQSLTNVFKNATNCDRIAEKYDKIAAKCDKIVTKCDKIATKCDKIATKCDKIAAKCDKITAKCDQLGQNVTNWDKMFQISRNFDFSDLKYGKEQQQQFSHSMDQRFSFL